MEQQTGLGFEVIGLVKDARYESATERPLGAFFLLNDQNGGLDGYSDLILRTRTDPAMMANVLREVIREQDPGLALSTVKALSEQVDDSLRTQYFLARLTTGFAGIALTLACLGLYGVLAYSVAQRNREIGIRMALGARPSAILRSLLHDSAGIVALGLLCGFPLVLGSGRWLESQLYGVTAYNPWLIGGCAAILLLTATIASIVPSRRAVLLDPLAVLRTE